MHNTEKEPEGCVELERKNTEDEGFLGEEPNSFLIRRQNVKALQEIIALWLDKVSLMG